jgi:hypothetical protein
MWFFLGVELSDIMGEKWTGGRGLRKYTEENIWTKGG